MIFMGRWREDVYWEVMDAEGALVVFAVRFGGQHSIPSSDTQVTDLNQPKLQKSSAKCDFRHVCLPGGFELLCLAWVENGNWCWRLGVKLRKHLF